MQAINAATTTTTVTVTIMETTQSINRTKMGTAETIATNATNEMFVKQTIIVVDMERDARHRSTTIVIDTTIQMNISTTNTKIVSGMDIRMVLVAATNTKTVKRMLRHRSRTKRRNTMRRRPRKSMNSSRTGTTKARQSRKWTRQIVRSARN